MVIKSYLTSDDNAQIENSLKKNKPVPVKKQKLQEKQERMFTSLDKDFNESIVGLGNQDKIIAIQKKFAGNGVNVSQLKIDKMMVGEFTVVKPGAISPPVFKPISVLESGVFQEIKIVDNILDYQIYDSLGIVGPFATTAELKYFREYVFRLDQYVALKEFLEAGASLITQELTDDIFMLESSDKAIKKMLNVLQKLMDESDTVMIIGDGS